MQRSIIRSRFERIVNEHHRSPQAAERVAEELEPFDYLPIVDNRPQILCGKIRILERALGANEEGFDPADRHRTFAQVVGEEQDEVLELVPRTDDRAGHGLPRQHSVAGSSPGASPLALAVVGCAPHGSTFQQAQGNGKFFTWPRSFVGDLPI